MKKLFALALVAGLGISFVGCGEEPAKPKADADKPAASGTPEPAAAPAGDTTPPAPEGAAPAAPAPAAPEGAAPAEAPKAG